MVEFGPVVSDFFDIALAVANYFEKVKLVSKCVDITLTPPFST